MLHISYIERAPRMRKQPEPHERMAGGDGLLAVDLEPHAPAAARLVVALEDGDELWLLVPTQPDVNPCTSLVELI